MTDQIPPSTLLAALLAAAFVLLAPNAQAAAVPLFGSETTVVIAPGRAIVNGGAGRFSSQGQTRVGRHRTDD